ncbi:uncharacterized protein [Periplaneta americana]|uniref:uncharacterized protein isoform X1 n=1 Tax=Periplaneta americana TaxID=6978 RepID=UPI0037E8975A
MRLSDTKYITAQKPNLEHHTSRTGTSHEIPDNSDRILTSDEYSQLPSGALQLSDSKEDLLQDILASSLAKENKEILRLRKVSVLEWAGHLVRMDDTRPAKRAFTSNPRRSRSKGRPKSRWEDNVYEDANFIGARMWTVKARSRDGWNKILRKARTLNGLLSQ